MANEISHTLRLQLTNSPLRDDNDPGRVQVTQTALGMSSQVLTIGTSEETVSLGDISTPGWCYLVNCDSTNYVEVGFSTGVYGIRLKAGEPAHCFRLNSGVTIYAKANTAACKVLFKVYEN